MFGEIGPRLKGGLNTLLAYSTSTLLTLKGVFNVGVTVAGGDGNGLKSGSATTSASGGAVNVTGGTGFSAQGSSLVAGQGGQINITGGVAGGLGNGGLGGGPVTIAGGIGSVDSGGLGTVGGAITVRGGQGGGFNAAGGAVTVKGGAGGSTGSSSHGGDLTLSGGDNGNNGHGGNVTLSAGTNQDSTLGATVTITGTGQAGNVAVTAGTGWTTAGVISLTGGAASSGNNNGGAVNLTGGAPAGSGTKGKIVVKGQLDLTDSTAGQIAFPASQNASSGANVLDDYEEGTFTPTIVSTGGGAPTYTAQVGRYTKTGNRVSFSVAIILATTGTLAAGDITIAGLPFTSNATSNNYQSASCYCNVMAATVTGAPQALIFPSATDIHIYQFAAGSSTAITVGGLAGTSQIMVSGHFDV